MKVDVTTVDSYQRRISFVIPHDQVRNRLDAEYQRLGRRARIAGFRPGKVPRKVLEARFAPQVEAEVANELVNKSYQSAVKDHSLDPVSQPSLQEAGPVADAEGFKFTVTVEVRPSIELSTWTGVDVVYPTVVLGGDEIDAAVKARTESRARLDEVTGRGCEKGDLALAEVKVTEGETELLHEPGTMIRTAGDPYLPGLEDVLVGMSTNDEKTAEVTFAANARTEAVAGKTCQVTVKILSLQAQVVPELTDELATELGYEGGVGGMRQALEAQLRQGREEMARNQARANLLEVLIAKNPFEVPQSMVESSLKMLIDELRNQQAMRTGRDPRTIGFNEAQIRDLRARSSFAAKAALILEWVARKEGVKVEEADLERKYAELAGQRGQTVEAVRGWFKKEDAVSELKDRILEEKTLDWLLERANLVTPPAEAAATEGSAT
jgi:trigger factor